MSGLSHQPTPAEWAGLTATTWSKDESLARRFVRIAAERPDAIAIDDRAMGQRSITYGDLNRISNTIAGVIHDKLGDGPANVGVMCQSDVEALASMLGVFKAGKTAVPLMTGGPLPRTTAVLDHADVPLVVAHDAGEVNYGRTVIDTANLDAADGREDILVDRPLDEPLRLMFTSGSTGMPKGVIQPHHYLIDKSAKDAAFFGYGPDDRLTQLLPIAFAMATSHSLGAILNGGTLCSYDPSKLGFHGLADYLLDTEITGFQVVPSLFRRFLDRLSPDITFPSLRYVILGGEKVTAHDLELFKRHFHPSAMMLNAYASTETGAMTRYVMTHDTELGSPIVPSGFATPGKTARVIDEAGNDVPHGESGQIIVESDFLGAGYWGSDEQTAAAFDHSGTGGVYRTGDLGRFREDGALEHLGRLDSRVKIAGYGVDLTEVETALLSLDEVSEAIAVARDTEDGTGRLLGYVVGESLSADDTSGLRVQLNEMLPHYAVPSDLIVLDEMPLTSRGKVDRSALPAPRDRSATTPVATDGTLESKIATIWQEILGVAHVGPDDAFADLGGSSIQALEMFAELHSRHGIDVAPTTLLTAPTVGALAAAIEAGAEGSRQTSMVLAKVGGDATPWFCMHGGGGGVFFMGEIAKNLGDNRTLYAVQAQGFEGTAPPYRPIPDMAGFYIDEIRAVQPEGPYLIGGLSFGGLLATEISKQLTEAGQEVALVTLLDTAFPGSEPEQARGAQLHLDRMKEQGWIDRVKYVFRYLWRRTIGARLRRRKIQRTVAAGEQLPMHGRLRESYFWSLHRRASAAYDVPSISSPMLIMASEGNVEARRNEWGPVAQGGLVIHEVPAPHLEITLEPAVFTLADHLQRELDEADPRV